MWLCNQNWHGEGEGPSTVTWVDVTSNHSQQHKETELMIAMEISQEAEWVFSKVLVSGIYCNNNQEKKKKKRKT